MANDKILADLRENLARLDAKREAILKKVAPLQAAADAQALKVHEATARHRELAQKVVDLEERENLRSLSLERGKLGRAIGALQGGHTATITADS